MGYAARARGPFEERKAQAIERRKRELAEWKDELERRPRDYMKVTTFLYMVALMRGQL